MIYNLEIPSHDLSEDGWVPKGYPRGTSRPYPYAIWHLCHYPNWRDFSSNWPWPHPFSSMVAPPFKAVRRTEPWYDYASGVGDHFPTVCVSYTVDEGANVLKIYPRTDAWAGPVLADSADTSFVVVGSSYVGGS